MPSKQRIPAYRRQGGAGTRPDRAFVLFPGRPRIYLGDYGAAASRERYARLIAQWRAGQGIDFPDGRRRACDDELLTVEEIIAAYLERCDVHYRDAEGRPTSEVATITRALAVLRRLYGSTPAAHFGPRALKAVRADMIAAGRVRPSINRDVGRIKAMFRWAVEEEQIPPSVYEGLRAVRGLARGRSEAPEPEPVRPVPDDAIEATLPHLPRDLADLVRLHRLTGARSGELLSLRPGDIDTSGDVWTAALEHHKTRHHGHERTLYFGPGAQAILRPLMLRRPPGAYLFSPAASEADRLAERHAARTTPLNAGNRPGTNRVAKRRRPPRDRYDVTGYARAIARAVRKANAERKAQSVADGVEWAPIPHWHPHQIRHTVATELRRTHGLEVARTLLGHSTITMAQHYAEADNRRALAVAREVG